MQNIHDIFLGFATGGYWLLVDNVQKVSVNVISSISQIIFNVRQKLVNGAKSFQFESEKSHMIGKSLGIFLSFAGDQNPLSYEQPFHEIPASIKENFRILNL